MLKLFTMLNRQRAAGIFLKAGENEQGKAGTEIETVRELNWTQTTLRCFVRMATGKAQKSAIYAPRRVSIRLAKAEFCRHSPYETALETSYFNGLRSRPGVMLSVPGKA
jgi:hypothetical protein